MSTSATRCPDCGEPTPTGGWVDAQSRVHHVGCGDPLGTKAATARIAELEAALSVSRDLNRKYVDALRKVAGCQASVEMLDDDETAAAEYSRALACAKLIARQALPITV